MKLISEKRKLIISTRIIAIITLLMILALIPALHIGCINMFTMEKDNGNTFLWIGIILSLIIVAGFFLNIILSQLTLKDLSKIENLLTNGIYSKAKVINIKETNSHTIFYLQLLHHNYKNVILEHKIRHIHNDPESQSNKKREVYPIKKSNSVLVIAPRPKAINDPIMYLNEDSYLTLNSVVSVLYNSYNDWMLCPWWDIWRRENLLDDYDQDTIENEEIYKQRTISRAKLFSNLLAYYKLIHVTALVLLALSLLAHKGFFMVMAIIECCLFLMWFVWSQVHLKRHHDFYEYSVATIGTITSATEIIEKTITTEKNGKEVEKENIIWIYKYTFTTEEGIPYQGEMKISPKHDIRPYEQDSPATILYDPYCTAQNCLAFYYPYSWIQPEETKDLYRIKTIQPDIEENVLESI